MSTTVTPVELDDDAVFSAESYRKHAAAIPSMDGHRAAVLELRFAGSGRLDPTSTDDVRLLQAARLGEEVLLLVRCEFSGKTFKLAPKGDGERELGFAATVRVLEVQAADAA